MSLNPASTFTALANVSATTTATQLGSNSCRTVVVQSLPANTVNIFLGSTSGVTTAGALAHTALQPGEARAFNISNTSLLYVISASGTPTMLLGIMA